MSGRVSSSGRSGPNRRSTKKFARLFYLARHQGSGQRKLTLPNARCPAKRMSLKNMGSKASLPPKNRVTKQKPPEACQKRFANSSLISTAKCQRGRICRLAGQVKGQER